MSLGSVTAKNQCLAGTYGDDSGGTAPVSFTFRLYNGDPTGSGVEFSGSGYSPVTVANTTANFGTPSGGQLGPIALQYPQATADWGTPTWWAATDGSGNIWDYGPISNPFIVVSGLIFILNLTLLAA